MNELVRNNLCETQKKTSSCFFFGRYFNDKFYIESQLFLDEIFRTPQNQDDKRFV